MEKEEIGICVCGVGYESCVCPYADKREREGIDEALVTLNKKLAVRYAKGGDLHKETLTNKNK